jgi:hypothetical protein
MRARYFTALVFGLALPSLALAWTASTSTLPNGDTNAPVNVGGVMQLKNGTLGVNGLGVFGNTILVGTNGDGTNNGTLEFRNSSGSWSSTSKSSL